MVQVKCEFKVDDKKWKKLVTNQMSDLARSCFLVGIPSGSKAPRTRHVSKNGRITYKPSPINMATLGWIMENGSKVNRIPPRPFMKHFLTKNGDGINKRMKNLFDAIIRGDDVEKRMKRLTASFKSMMQLSISSGEFQANNHITVNGGWLRNRKSGKPVKIAPKKSTKPLMDTGALRQSIICKVAKATEGNG